MSLEPCSLWLIICIDTSNFPILVTWIYIKWGCSIKAISIKVKIADGEIRRVKTLIIHPFKTPLKSIWWLNITKNMLGTLSYGCINPKWSTWIELWFISHSTSFIRLIVRWMNPESQCMQYWMILSIILPPYESSYSNGSCVHNMEKIY